MRVSRGGGRKVGLGAVQVESDDILGDGSEIGRPDVIAQRCAGARRVDVWSCMPIAQIIHVHGSEIDAVAREAARIRHRRMQLSSGE